MDSERLRIGIVCAHLIQSLGWREHYLANGLSQLGHKVSVFTSDRKPWRHFYGDKRRIREELACKYDVKRILTPFEIGESPMMSPLLSVELVSSKLDILDIHEFYHQYSILAGIVCRMSRIPFVVSSERLGSNVKGTRDFLFNVALKPGVALMNRAKKIIAASERVKNYLKLIGAPMNRIVTIPNGVDTSTFRFAESDQRDKLGFKDDLLIGYFGALRPGKGVEVLIMAMRLVKNKYANVRLLCVGEGPLREKLQSLSGQLGVDGTVFRGFVPHDELPEFYSAVDVVACPVTFGHAGGPFVVLEAMACGKPVVGTSLQQIPEFVVHGENGFIVDPGDPRSLAKHLLVLLGNRELRERMGQAGRRRAESFFDWKVICKMFERAYVQSLSTS